MKDMFMAGDRKRATLGDVGIARQREGLGRGLWALLLVLGVLAPGAWADNANGEPVGSGDGRIHVIPTLSRPSVKNGEKLSIQAIVKAPAGVASVEALIKRESPPATADWTLAGVSAMNGLPVARFDLSPAPGKLGGVNETDTMGLWQADWTAHNLEEAWYRVTLTITDQTGHQYQDATLRFSDPIAGIDTIGTTEYPNGGMRRMDAVELPFPENMLANAVIDAENGYAYFATGDSGVPGGVVKVALGEGGARPSRVGLAVFEGETDVRSAIIDTKNGYAYFGTNNRIVKVALGEGDSPPIRVATMTLLPGEGLNCAVIDPENGHAYFTLEGQNPGRVLKVALGEGDAPPTRLGTVTLNDGEYFLSSAVIDPESGYAWFATRRVPGRVVKVSLGVGNAPPVRVGAVTLNEGEDRLVSAVIDVENGYALFGTDTMPGQVVKVALGEGDAPPTRIGSVTLSNGEDRLFSSAIDPARGYAWFGTDTSPGRVVKVALGEGDAPPTRVGAVALNNGEDRLWSSVIDPERGYAWFGSNTSPGHVIKVALGEGDAESTRTGALTLVDGDNSLASAVIDRNDGYAYFGTRNRPGRVLKVALSDGNVAPVRVGALSLNADEDQLVSAVIDPEQGYAWFGTDTIPGRVVKVALGEGGTLPTRVGGATLEQSEHHLWSAVIDVENKYAYFGTATFPGRVLKVALGMDDDPPLRVGSLTLSHEDSVLQRAVIDPRNGFAYFSTSVGFGTQNIIKIALGDVDGPPRRVGAGLLHADADADFTSAVIDTRNGFAYFSFYSDSRLVPHSIVKLELGVDERPPRIHSVLRLPPADGRPRSAVLDEESGYAWYGAFQRILKVRLGAGSAQPTRMGAVTLAPGESNLATAVLDSTTGYAYFGTANVPGRIVRVALSQKGFVKATRLTLPENGEVEALRFFSHQAVGNLRLALYDAESEPTLLWESDDVPNTAEEDWLNVPVSSGTPSSLVLPAGDYWLAWQIDTMADVASFVQGTESTGLQVPQAFGAFPQSLEAGTDTASTYTDENWSAYAVYGLLDNTPPNALSVTPETTGPSNATTVSFIVDFDEPVQNFDDASDLFVDHTGTASTHASITGGPESYTVTVAGISGDGSFTLSVNTASGVVDLAGNPLASSVTSVPVVIDNTPPVLTALTVSPSALAPGDGALIQFEVSEMLLGDPVVEVAGMPAVAAPLKAVKSLGHTYLWTAPLGAPVGRIIGRHLVPGLGYVNPDPWPYGPREIEITLTDLAGNTITHTEPEGLALVSGLPLAWPGLAFLAMIFAAAFALRKPGKARVRS